MASDWNNCFAMIGEAVVVSSARSREIDREDEDEADPGTGNCNVSSIFEVETGRLNEIRRSINF
jgi:hypothetical protein